MHSIAKITVTPAWKHIIERICTLSRYRTIKTVPSLIVFILWKIHMDRILRIMQRIKGAHRWRKVYFAGYLRTRLMRRKSVVLWLSRLSTVWQSQFRRFFLLITFISNQVTTIAYVLEAIVLPFTISLMKKGHFSCNADKNRKRSYPTLWKDLIKDKNIERKKWFKNVKFIFIQCCNK